MFVSLLLTTFSLASQVQINGVSQVKTSFDIPIIFVSDFTEESAKKFDTEVKNARDVGSSFVVLEIDSYGGSVYSLLRMVSTVQALQRDGIIVATIVQGKAMSAASVLFACGSNGYRFVGPFATIMIHSVSSVASGKLPDLVGDVNEATRLNTILFHLLAQQSGKSDSYFLDLVKDHSGVDWFLSAEDAVSLGLANKLKVPTLKTKVTIENIVE